MTIEDGKSTGLRAGEEMDRAACSREITRHTSDRRGREKYWTESGRGDGQGDME